MSNLLKRSLWVLGLCLVLTAPGRAEAQARNGKLLVTVVDQTGGVLPSAVVTIVGIEDATRRTAIAPVHATDKGLATFDNLLPGRYSIAAEFPGFTSGGIKDARVRAGENKQTVTLSLSTLSDVATASIDRQEAAADRQMTFGTALTREQIDALSDDPAELQRQLNDMAGVPDAVISVDSFEGRQLPSKAQIKSIRITRDQFAAEVHAAGQVRIEVVTQPGVGPLRGGVGMNFYDSSMDGRNPIVQQRGPSQNKGGYANLSGSLLQERMSFNIYTQGSGTYSTPVLKAGSQSGTQAQLLNTRDRQDYRYFYTGIDYAITKDQLLRVGVGRNTSSSFSGAGGYNAIERGYSSTNSNNSVYVQEMGPLGRRFVTNTRFSLYTSDSGSHSAVEAPTVIVPEEFTLGGAQRTGGTHTRSASLGSDLDYVRGIHSVRVGAQIDGTSYRSDSNSNYLGTYTFESLTDYLAGTPRSFTQRIGDPNIKYSNVQAGFYVQDDIRLRKALTITPGLRYEAQTHLSDYNNFGPRFGLTWAPFKSGKTTLRASAGIFYDWLNTGTYQQTLQVDGLRQQDLNIANPSYPDPGLAGVAGVPTIADRYLLADGLAMGRNSRLSTGINQTFNPRLQAGVTYAYIRGSNLLVGDNLNAPVDGARPDATFANVIEARSEGALRQHTINSNMQLNLAGLIPNQGMVTGPLLSWKRGLRLSVNYTYTHARNNTDGAFSVPATGDLSQEWGPSFQDIRHRGGFSLGSQFLRNLNASIGFNGSSAGPLNIRTGTDDNGDLIFNDRPFGVTRNSARTSGRWTTDGYFGYSISLGHKSVNTGGGVTINSVGGSLVANALASQSVPRYRLFLNVSIQNMTNHANFSGYSGVITSTQFLTPSQADGVRRISFSTSLTF